MTADGGFGLLALHFLLFLLDPLDPEMFGGKIHKPMNNRAKALQDVTLSCLLPEVQQPDVLLVVPVHEAAMLLCLLPRSLLSQAARLLLVLLS